MLIRNQFLHLYLENFPALIMLAGNLEKVSLDISISPQVIILGVS